jgi:endoglucanase
MNRRVLAATFVIGLTLLSRGPASAARIVEVLPLTDRILMVHIAEGTVVHHQRGTPRSDEKVVIDPLDTVAASRLDAYSLTSTDDPQYSQTGHPIELGRKSKGTDFAWFADKWENGRAVNTRPDHTKEHWLYLFLPKPMQQGKSYTLDTGNLVTNGRAWPLTFDERTARSEAVHVNLLGYVPASPQKFGYVFHWMGDKGGLDLKAYEGRRFNLCDSESRQPVFAGKLVFRMPATQPETGDKTNSPPHGNFLKADVYECDFSSFGRPGRYF